MGENLLIVQNGSQVEPLNYIQSLQIEKEVNGSHKVSFTSFNYEDNPAYELLQEESIVTVDGFDFRVKQLNENRFSKKVTAINTFFDLANQRHDEIYGGTHTLAEFASFVFSGTGWTFTTDISDSVFIANYGNANILTLVNNLCIAFECEYEILPNKIIHFTKQIGGENNAQYRFAHNVKTLSKKVDTTKLKTQITGFGANGLVVTYTSQIAENPQIGIRIDEPVIDDRFTQPETMTQYLKLKLIDYPEVSFEMDVIELTEKELGERVWLIYEPMNIEFQTRILKQTREILNGEIVTTKVILGNIVSKSSTDILISQKVEIDQNKKETRSRFEQTNERITMEVEEVNSSIAKIEIRAGEIEQSVVDLETETESKITQTAAEIRSEVEGKVTTINGTITEINESISSITQTQNQIQSTVSSQTTEIGGLNQRVSNAESSITQTANQISSKVSYSDYNGNTITSMINQTAAGVTISASKINLIGITNVANELQLGSSADGSFKGITFGGSNRISNSGSTLTISAQYLVLDAVSVSWGNNAPAARFG